MAADGSELLVTQPNGCCLLLLHHGSTYGLRVLGAQALALACMQTTTMILHRCGAMSLCYAVHANMLGCRSTRLATAQQAGAARKGHFLRSPFWQVFHSSANNNIRAQFSLISGLQIFDGQSFKSKKCR